MTNKATDAFKAQYRESYGTYRMAPDFTRCAESVHGGGRWPSFHQCARKNGHGPEGAWCRQHDPVARKTKDDAKQEEWRKRRDREANLRKLKAERMDIIKQIASGHNDPRGLCIDYLERWGTVAGGENEQQNNNT